MSDPIPTTPEALRAAQRAAVPLGGAGAAQPQRPPNARTTTPSERTQARWAHTARLVEAARAEGRAEAERIARAEHRKGWRWGFVCGCVVASVLALAAALLHEAGRETAAARTTTPQRLVL